MPEQLPEDWRPPVRELIEKAWNEHPQVDVLNARKAERDTESNPTWTLRDEDDGNDPEWAGVWLRPFNPRDARESIRITRYPRKWEDREMRDAGAVGDEFGDD
jgi:hypothetical protein